MSKLINQSVLIDLSFRKSLLILKLMDTGATCSVFFPLSGLMPSKKILLSIFLIFFFTSMCLSQNDNPELNTLQKLDSISHSPSISKHFAKLYYNTTVVADNFFADSDEKVRSFMQQLEDRFGDYFFEAAHLYETGKPIPEVWSAYFSDTTLSETQYFLLGANAHINGDIWKALTTEFSLQDIQENKQGYFSFYKGLKKIYADVYETAISSAKKADLLHHLTFGFDRIYGKIMLKRWRKRQMQLAILYFTNKPKFERKLKSVKSKMNRLNRMICKYLS